MAEPPPGWKPLAADTSYDAERALFAAYRRLQPWQALEKVAAARRRMEFMAEQEERLRHPTADDAEIRLRVVARRFDRATMLRVYGRDPARDAASIGPSTRSATRCFW
jgi:hypothetical protein